MTSVAPAPAVRVAGSASPRVSGLLSAPAVRAPVVHGGRDAAYVEVRGRCVGVLSTRAVLVPCGIRTPLPELPPLPTEVLVGGGAVELPGCRVEVVGSIDPCVGRLTHDGVRRARATGPAAAAAAALEEVRALLPAEALGQLAAGDPACVSRLLGRGPGLTPLGDDVLSGWLVTAFASGDPALPRVRDTVEAAAAHGTTLLSATLLECAGHGEALPELRDLLWSLAADRRDAWPAALGRLLSVGGTSGAGLALGCLNALDPAGDRR